MRSFRLSRPTNRQCGKCSLCCKLMAVPKLNKPANTWCPSAKPGCGGCTIYATRPKACRDFECWWVRNTSSFGDEWFPVRCKMVIAALIGPGGDRADGLKIFVDPDYPNAWRREPYYSQLLTIAQGMCVTLLIGRRGVGLRPDGTEYAVEVRTTVPGVAHEPETQ
jgi:hypothetical protein